MQRSLFALVLMGQCFLFVCRLHDYHFINESKTWEEAQKFCRQNYTDLAKVFNMDDVERLLERFRGEAWIGLKNQSDANRTWFWSQPEVDFTESEWADDEPNDINKPENCAGMDCDHDKWTDLPCSEKKKFICYNDTQKKSHRITEEMNWLEAQNYCRENHTDLISGIPQLEDLKELECNDAKQNDAKHCWWIGLFRDRWIWSDGTNSSFRNWDPTLFRDEANKECALTQPNGKWSSDDCNKTKPFFCYGDKMILIQQKKTWFQALDHCRNLTLDLVSITNSQQQIRVQQRVKEADSTYVWLGLRYTCTMDLWFWVSDNLVCYENWNQRSKAEVDQCYMAAVMKNEGGQWEKKAETETFYFICAAN